MTHVIEEGGRKYIIRELTFGDVNEYIDRSSDTVYTPSGDVKKVVSYGKAQRVLLSLCIEVEENGARRRLSEQEINNLPASLGLRLVNECFKVNSFLLQT